MEMGGDEIISGNYTLIIPSETHILLSRRAAEMAF